MPRRTSADRSAGNGANLGFEEKLWQAADKLRGHMDAAEYKHVVLGLVFLKYISDAFEEYHQLLLDLTADPDSDYYLAEERARYDVAEDRDEYTAENVFWVPQEARWSYLQANAKQPTIGKLIDEAMAAIERENPSLRGVLNKDYARYDLDKFVLGQLVDLIGTIALGGAYGRSKDVLGRVYEYFLGKFANAEGRNGGQFYTPRSIVKLLVEMIEPLSGRVLDPCCGSGGMFVQSERFVEAHGGRSSDLSIFGQESNPTTWRLAKMNLAIRGIEANLGREPTSSFHNDQHKDLRADFILANPPFNDDDWGYSRVKGDPRWVFGEPPAGGMRKDEFGNEVFVDGGYANYAWIQHFIFHLAPNGTAGFVMANGALSSNKSGEGAIRKAIIEADLVDCVVTLPNNLFYTTTIPACLWFVRRNKQKRCFRDRRDQTLFIDARKLGRMIDRRHRELTDDEIARIAETYRTWRGEPGAGAYEDMDGFCRSVSTAEIASHGYVLTPGRYVGAEEVEEDDEPFGEKMRRLAATLEEQFTEASQLEQRIRIGLGSLNYV